MSLPTPTNTQCAGDTQEDRSEPSPEPPPAEPCDDAPRGGDGHPVRAGGGVAAAGQCAGAVDDERAFRAAVSCDSGDDCLRTTGARIDRTERVEGKKTASYFLYVTEADGTTSSPRLWGSPSDPPAATKGTRVEVTYWRGKSGTSTSTPRAGTQRRTHAATTAPSPPSASPSASSARASCGSGTGGPATPGPRSGRIRGRSASRPRARSSSPCRERARPGSPTASGPRCGSSACAHCRSSRAARWRPCS